MWTQDDIDALKAAMAQGIKRVRYVSGEVEYQSLADMRQQLADMQREVSPQAAPPARTVARYSGGF